MAVKRRFDSISESFRRVVAAALMVCCALISTPRAAHAQLDEPVLLEYGAACGDVLSSGDERVLITAAAYAFGYIDASTGMFQDVPMGKMVQMIDYLRSVCTRDQNQNFALMVRDLALSEVARLPPMQGEGERLLTLFLAAGADHAALTQSLIPRPEDVRAVYHEPLASRLISFYNQIFASGVIAPGPGQTEVISTFVRASELKAGAAELASFPPGYRDVLPYLRATPQADHPIGRFKFVRPGEPLGMSFEGLIFVNNRWVLMPMPWRGL